MYFGSVRFFKHVILGLLLLLIAVPLTVSVVLGVQNHVYRQRLGLAAETGGDTGMRAAAAEAEAGGERPELPAGEGRTEGTQAVDETDPAYQSLYPDLYAAEGPRGTVDEEKTAYLTFDDGPSAQTVELMGVLKQYGVKATFFAVGREDEQSKQWLRDIVAAGHTLGVHTYSHDYKKVYASVEAYLDDFDQMYRLIYDATGSCPQIFRFPGGSVNGYNAEIYQDIIAEMERRGFVYFDWNADAADTADNAQTENVARRALAAASERRAVVLLHDGGGSGTVLKALPAIIEGYLAAGFTFAPLTPETRQIILS